MPVAAFLFLLFLLAMSVAADDLSGFVVKKNPLTLNLAAAKMANLRVTLKLRSNILRFTNIRPNSCLEEKHNNSIDDYYTVGNCDMAFILWHMNAVVYDRTRDKIIYTLSDNIRMTYSLSGAMAYDEKEESNVQTLPCRFHTTEVGNAFFTDFTANTPPQPQSCAEFLVEFPADVNLYDDSELLFSLIDMIVAIAAGGVTTAVLMIVAYRKLPAISNVI